MKANQLNCFFAKKQLFIIALLAVAIGLVSCKDDDDESKSNNPQYSNTANWYWSMVDNSKPVDVLFFYPTLYAGEELYGTINDPSIAMVPTVASFQASVFSEQCSVYIPYYRQVNANKALAVPYNERKEVFAAVTGADCLASFEYYLTKYNNGKPFILAGHSQGAAMVLYLLEYLNDKPELLNRMVAAYAIGYSVTPGYLAENPNLKFAEGNNDTGVIVSWNTEKPGYEGPNPLVEPDALVINPINWKLDATYASKQESLGSRLMQNFSYVTVANFADARINPERSVVVSDVDLSVYTVMGNMFPKGMLHSEDYSLFYNDLKKNVKDRIFAFTEK